MTPYKRQTISRLLLSLLASASLIAQPALAAHKKEADSADSANSAKKTASTAESSKVGKGGKNDKSAKANSKTDAKSARKDKDDHVASSKKDGKLADKSDKQGKADKSDRSQASKETAKLIAAQQKSSKDPVRDKNDKLSAKEKRIQDNLAKAFNEKPGKAGRYAKGSKAEKLALAKSEKMDKADRGSGKTEKLTKAERAAQATNALIAQKQAALLVAQKATASQIARPDTRERRVISDNAPQEILNARDNNANRASDNNATAWNGEWAGPADSSPGLHSRSALLLDMQNGEALYQKNANAVVSIASITKLMTAMVMLDANLPMNEELVITNEDVDTLKGSRSRLAVGTRLTRQEALLLALMSSENRAAHALGRTYPGGIEAFIPAMNRKAQELGMTHSRFRDPTGLNSGNVSTARDLAKMVAAASKYSAIHQATTTSETRMDVLGRYQEYRNTNPLVRAGEWEIGLSKTGFIREAGKCLVMQAKVNNRPMLFVLLDSEASSSRVGDAIRLKKWAETTRS